MKNSNLNSTDTNTPQKQPPSSNEKLKRIHASREKVMEYQKFFPEQNAADFNEKDFEADIDDLYREEENRGRVEAA